MSRLPFHDGIENHGEDPVIGRITGRLDYRGEDHVLIEVNGVGYVVHCSERTRRMLPATGKPVSLFTDLLVRQDLLQLFGFATYAEREWHRLLIGVQGVGPRASMAILGTLGSDGLGRAIAVGDWNSIRAAKGIGPKTAQRVVNELREKVAEIMAMGNVEIAAADTEGVGEPEATAADVSVPELSSGNSQADALSALENLGYARGEAASAVAQAASDNPEAGEQVLIRSALKLLAPREG